MPEHTPDELHKDQNKHRDRTFRYDVVGIPTVGQKYNWTTVQKSDFARFDEEVLNAIKPEKV